MSRRMAPLAVAVWQQRTATVEPPNPEWSGGTQSTSAEMLARAAWRAAGGGGVVLTRSS